MPFTFSHPAIIIPFTTKQFKLSATGLIVGSIIPDFEYFIRMKVQSNYSHTLIGLLWFDFPLALIVCFIYHIVVRNSFINNSPVIIQRRLNKFKSFNWAKYFRVNLFVVCVSILIGAFSHLLWDSFTHETGFFVERSSGLQKSLNLMGLTLPIYKVIQHLSSLIGGLIIVIAFLLIKKTKINVTTINYKYWFVIIAVIMTIIIIRFIFGLRLNQSGDFFVTTISAGLASLILTPLITREITTANKCIAKSVADISQHQHL